MRATAWVAVERGVDHNVTRTNLRARAARRVAWRERAPGAKCAVHRTRVLVARLCLRQVWAFVALKLRLNDDDALPLTQSVATLRVAHGPRRERRNNAVHGARVRVARARLLKVGAGVAVELWLLPSDAVAHLGTAAALGVT